MNRKWRGFRRFFSQQGGELYATSSGRQEQTANRSTHETINQRSACWSLLPPSYMSFSCIALSFKQRRQPKWVRAEPFGGRLQLLVRWDFFTGTQVERASCPSMPLMCHYMQLTKTRLSRLYGPQTSPLALQVRHQSPRRHAPREAPARRLVPGQTRCRSPSPHGAVRRLDTENVGPRTTPCPQEV